MVPQLASGREGACRHPRRQAGVSLPAACFLSTCKHVCIVAFNTGPPELAWDGRRGSRRVFLAAALRAVPVPHGQGDPDSQRSVEMPIVTVEASAGRTIEQKRGLVKDITEAVVKNYKVSPDVVIIVIREIADEHLGKAGKLKIDK